MLCEALRAVLAAVGEQGATAEQLRALAAQVDALPPLPGAEHRKGALWRWSASQVLQLRASASAACYRGPRDEHPFRALYTAFPAQDRVDADAMLAAAVPRVACARAGELPEAARELLRAQMPFVLREHALWPAAEARWGERAFLSTELSGVSCAVLSAPARLKTFLYWMPPRRYRSLAAACAHAGDRVLAPYAFDEPSVSQLNLGVDEFFALADGRAPAAAATAARDQCFYLQHTVVKPCAERVTAGNGGGGSGAPATVGVSSGPSAREPPMGPTRGLGARMVHDITDGIDRSLLGEMRREGGLGPWVSTVLFVGGVQAAGARTRLHFDQVDNLYLQVHGCRKCCRLRRCARAWCGEGARLVRRGRAPGVAGAYAPRRPDSGRSCGAPMLADDYQLHRRTAPWRSQPATVSRHTVASTTHPPGRCHMMLLSRCRRRWPV